MTIVQTFFQTSDLFVSVGVSTENLDIKAQIGEALYNADYTKRVIIGSGVTIGSTVPTQPALKIPSGAGGRIIVDNYGSILGAGGSAGGGTGGDAILAESTCTIENKSSGTIYAGGGGGGSGGIGGTGGRGSYEYVTGSYFQCSWFYYWGGCGGGYEVYTYATAYTDGGAAGVGGAGGSGRGYNQLATSGSSGTVGSAGGTNAGTGGAGGTGASGGDWGASGGTGTSGSSGINGNYTNGSSGSPGVTGGLAGYYAKASSSSLITLVNNGTVAGRTKLDGSISIDDYFNLVSLLLHGNGTNATENNTFVDSSTNNFTITRNGNTTQGTFGPFGDNWSNYFDGNGDTLSTTAVNISSGDFTIESWVYLNAMPTSDSWPGSYSNWMEIIGVGSASLGDGWQFRIGQTVLAFGTNSDTTAVSATHGMSANTWYHLACVRSGNTYTLYVNGSSIGSATYTANAPGTGAFTWIGSETNQGAYLNGYISNLRLVTSALYTSNFTPSTTPLTAVTNTALLTCQSNRFRDNSTNNFTIIRNGDVSVQKFSPFAPTSAYSSSVIGGSGYFDGSGDYLSITGGASFNLSSGDWTVEAWVYVTVSANNMLLNLYDNVSSNSGLTFWVNPSNQLVVDNGLVGAIAAGTVSPGQWVHIAASRVSGTTTAYVNGTSVGTTTQPPNTAQFARIGILAGAVNYPFNGYVSNLRIVKGTALYTANFTPPTSPLTAVTNTSLLLNFTNAAIRDNTGINNLETVGNAQISTTQSKFSGSSLFFDGTGDQLLGTTSPNLIFGTGDFTIEAWVYQTQRNSLSDIVSCHNYGVDANWLWSINSSGNLYFQISGSGTGAQTSSSTVSLNTWTHVAVTRSNGTVKQFINGEVTSSATYSTSISNTIRLSVGSAANLNAASTFYGYIDDLRITKGFARYTANFTPPTEPFADR